MPEFSPGEAKIAIAPITAKPAGMDCEAELFLGDELTKVASSGGVPFVSTGAAKNVSLPITVPSEGTYHGYIDVFTEGMRFLAYKTKEDVIARAGLVLSFSNPQVGAVGWDAQVAEVRAGRVQEWVRGVPEPDGPITFDIDFTTFLLRVMERPAYPLPGPYWFGPYLVTIPKLGAYTWDSKAGKIDGISTINLPLSANESTVIGTVGGFNWISEGKWGMSLVLEETAPVNGKMDVAHLYIGQSIYIQEGVGPLDSLASPIVKAGERVTCTVKMMRAGYTYGWKLLDIHYPREYPPEAYEFTGRVTSETISHIERIWYYPPTWPAGVYYIDKEIIDGYEYHWYVDGKVPQFKATALVGRMFMGPQPIDTVIAENYHAEGTYRLGVDDLEFGYVSPGGSVAHPNPDAPAWTKATAYLNNWVRV